ncbi:hypothetical protein [Komagataeibacter sp. FXV3]|uniref:hypothetical protein n=1 Tax=Komagataeibacter sp. FXV3 TaxID=2608998 RepID=UPI00187B52FB|nr:hypothetical protein [Komagataeibacter sp. FXV3]MBE7728816.1 hypothetical protein [Komagataeibacter sp. FXV3]
MIIIIQCANSKRPDAGTLRNVEGKPVKFVARPDLAPKDGYVHARPDDISDNGESWRQRLEHYNESASCNPLDLLPACELYENPIYLQLAEKVGRSRLFILSAGWGLISADFLTPVYDITFSAEARGPTAYKRRRKGDHFADFCMLSKDTIEPVLFLGGKSYLPSFLSLTRNIKASRTICYNSITPPDAPGCNLVHFETTGKTNWHYSCAKAFLTGKWNPSVS